MNKPTIITEDDYQANALEEIRENEPEEIELHKEQLVELFEISEPSDAKNKTKLAAFMKDVGTGEDKGSWVYFPWSNKLIHMVNEDDFFALRTNRNKNLITDKEQSLLRATSIGIAGMSVGEGIAIGCIQSGMSNSIKIADFDVVDTTNMNRLQIGVQDLYKEKTTLAARRLYEANPFVDVITYDKGLSEANIDEFFNKTTKIDLVVDEIDDFKMKILIRIKAKEEKIPLIMMTSIGDNMLIDIERYDIDETVKPFLGRADEAVEKILSSSEITIEDMKRYSIELVEKKHIPIRAFESVQEIGKTLSGRPQLFSTVAVSGGVATMVIREIILGNITVNSGRYFVNLNQLTI